MATGPGAYEQQPSALFPEPHSFIPNGDGDATHAQNKPLPHRPSSDVNKPNAPEPSPPTNADGDVNGHPHPEDNPPPEDRQEEKDEEKEADPPGGYDDTPIPPAKPGYTLKFTFHRAINLPIADINSWSSDPFILAQLNTALESRHKEDPMVRLRSNTVRRNCDPVWEWEWIVAHVPASGFKLKARIYDEDPADHDDRLGNVHVNVPAIDENWGGIHDKGFKVKKRMGSKRAYTIRTFRFCLRKVSHMSGMLFVSVEVLGKSEGPGGRIYTLGPGWWTKHYSPLLGRITGRKETAEEQGDHVNTEDKHGAPKAQRYNFQANQIQLRGPVPESLYHRYVEFRPIIGRGFTKQGVAGFLFNKALHHQHNRVYNFDRSTEYGVFPFELHQSPSEEKHHNIPAQVLGHEELTKKFLELAHYDQGGRIYTYVLTLDALWRFTETGKEFGIDMLSKHTMHSDVSIYIAYSGEFFVRRLKHKNRQPPEEGGRNATHPPENFPADERDEIPKDPSYYELVIDNDSGTYRPNAEKLPDLKKFLQQNLPGLKVVTLDSQKDAEKMAKMKQEQRDLKAQNGDRIIYTQLSDDSSSDSSSDEEALDEVERRGERRQRGPWKTTGKDLKRTQWGSRKTRYKREYMGKDGKLKQGAIGKLENEARAASSSPTRGVGATDHQ